MHARLAPTRKFRTFLRRAVRLQAAVCAATASLACAAVSSAAAPFTVAEDIALSQFQDLEGGRGGVLFSPDERYFVVQTEHGSPDQNRPESTLRVYRIADLSPSPAQTEAATLVSPAWLHSASAYKNGPNITSVRWLADSSGLAFLARTSSGNNQLFLAETSNWRTHALTAPDRHIAAFDIRDAETFAYSARSLLVAAQAQARRRATRIVVPGKNIYSLLFPEHLYPSLSETHDLTELWTVREGRARPVIEASSNRPVTLHQAAASAFSLSPDGRFLVTIRSFPMIPVEWETLYPPPFAPTAYRIRAGRQDPEAIDGHEYVSGYVLVDLSNGTTTSLTNAPIGNHAGWWHIPGAGWSADGRSVVLSNTFLAEGAPKNRTEKNRPCVAVVDVRTKWATCLERLKGSTMTGWEGNYRYIREARYLPNSNTQIAITYSNFSERGSPRGSSIYTASPAGTWTEMSTTSGPAIGRHEMDVRIRQSFTEPPVLIADIGAKGKSTVIWDPNPQLKNVQLGEASIFKWKDATGRDWIGGLYLPPGHVAGRRYPLVIQTHGFLPGRFIPSGLLSTAFAARPMAAAGIAVLQLEDCAAQGRNEGSCQVAGYESAVAKLADDGLIDPDRVGIVGFSRTCYYVLAALTTSKLRFKAALISDGINAGYLQAILDVDAYGEGIKQDAEALNGGSLFGKGLQQWLKHAPLFNMERVSTPLQVVAAEGPRSLLIMWEPYATLRYLDKPVDFIYLPEQGTHPLTNPVQRMTSQGLTVDWFRFWLLDQEDPDPAKAGQYARWRTLRARQTEIDASDS